MTAKTKRRGNSQRLSLHDTILKDVQKKIVSGTWPPGHRIPRETDMALHYGCSRMTVNKALTQLSRAGLLQRNKKWGTFVSAQQTISAALQITNIQQEVENAGKDYSYGLLKDHARPAKKQEARLMDLNEGSSIREIWCLHYADGKPFCFEERIVNLLAAPEIAPVNFDTVSPGAWMLRNVPWSSAEHQIIAEPADAELSKILEIPVGSACLVIERKTENDHGCVTWTRLAYSGAQHRLIALFTPTG